ncbi:MAG: hypothetical protein V1725_07050 [archaeon]
MAIDSCFLVDEEERTSFIEEYIVGILPDEEGSAAREKAKELVNKYAGQDINALSVLAYAASKGRFAEFVDKLEFHHEENLRYVHPEARRLSTVPGAVRAETFFSNCYKALCITSRN